MKILPKNRGFFIIVFFLISTQAAKASSINLYPQIPQAYTNITIEVNITGSPGDTWEVIVVTPSGDNETIDSGTLGASGNYLANYTYNSTERGMYHVDILLNSQVNTTNCWLAYRSEQNSEETFALIYALEVEIPYTSNASSQQHAHSLIFSLDVNVPYTEKDMWQAKGMVIVTTGIMARKFTVGIIPETTFSSYEAQQRYVSGIAKILYAIVKETKKYNEYYASPTMLRLNVTTEGKAYLVFTKSEKQKFLRRVNLVVSGKAFSYPVFSFARELNKNFRIFVILSYEDVLFNTLKKLLLYPGTYEIRVTYQTKKSNKPVIKIEIE